MDLAPAPAPANVVEESECQETATMPSHAQAPQLEAIGTRQTQQLEAMGMGQASQLEAMGMGQASQPEAMGARQVSELEAMGARLTYASPHTRLMCEGREATNCFP